MPVKAIVAACLVGLLLLATALLLLQKERVKTGIKIAISQLRNSAWLYGEAYGYRYRLAVPPESRNNVEIKKPLVVYLHGAGERGRDNRIQIYDLWYLGAGGKKNYESFQSRHSSFVYVPQCLADETWNDKKVLAGVTRTIEELISNYAIDPQRLYLIGYSMGGSGSYALAAHYFRATGHHFAAIIRLAGQSVFDRTIHEAAARSRVWLHVGRKDLPLRIKAAEAAWRNLKELHPGAVEESREITIPGHPGTASSLWYAGKEVARFSLYREDGHGISDFPFMDPGLLDWLLARVP